MNLDTCLTLHPMTVAKMAITVMETKILTAAAAAAKTWSDIVLV